MAPAADLKEGLSTPQRLRELALSNTSTVPRPPPSLDRFLCYKQSVSACLLQYTVEYAPLRAPHHNNRDIHPHCDPKINAQTLMQYYTAGTPSMLSTLRMASIVAHSQDQRALVRRLIPRSRSTTPSADLPFIYAYQRLQLLFLLPDVTVNVVDSDAVKI